jgi:hypothetical protein
VWRAGHDLEDGAVGLRPKPLSRRLTPEATARFKPGGPASTLTINFSKEINEMMNASIAAMIIALCGVIIERLQGRLNERFKEIENRLQELELTKVKPAKAKTQSLTAPADPVFVR